MGGGLSALSGRVGAKLRVLSRLATRISDSENPEELVCVSIEQDFDAATFAALFLFQRRAVFMPVDLVLRRFYCFTSVQVLSGLYSFMLFATAAVLDPRFFWNTLPS